MEQDTYWQRSSGRRIGKRHDLHGEPDGRRRALQLPGADPRLGTACVALAPRSFGRPRPRPRRQDLVEPLELQVRVEIVRLKLDRREVGLIGQELSVAAGDA